MIMPGSAPVQENYSKLTIDNFRSNIVGINSQVPVLSGTHLTYINFDNAASTPSLVPVNQTIQDFLGWYSSVHRGSGYKSMISTHAYEEARTIVLSFLGGDHHKDTVIFLKNTTEAINKMANRFVFKNRDIVITTKMEHHSDDLPWRKRANVHYANLTPEGEIDLNHLEFLIEQFSQHLALVAITGASNITGYINPIHAIAEKVHQYGGKILVDAAQLAPHRAIDMYPHSDPGHLDYVVLSAHKMYAPFGTGVLVGSKETFESGDPDMVGGGTVDLVTFKEVRWTTVPEKEEAGSPNVIGAVALASSMLALQQVGLENLARHEARLTAYALEKLIKIEGVRIFGNRFPEQSSQRLGVIPLNIEGISHYLAAAILSMEQGIGVRNGCFCAHPYILNLLDVPPELVNQYQSEIKSGKKANLPGMIRVSFGGYNTLEEIDRLAAALQMIVKREFKGHYQQDPESGAFFAEGFHPDPSRYFSLANRG